MRRAFLFLSTTTTSSFHHLLWKPYLLYCSTASHYHLPNMVPSDATKTPQGSRTRRPAVPVAIPLTYTQKRSQAPDAPNKKLVNTTVTDCPISPPISPPTSDASTGQQPSATFSAISDPSLNDRIQVADQTKDQAPSAAVSKPGQAPDDNIESTDNGLENIHNVKAASTGKHSPIKTFGLQPPH